MKKDIADAIHNFKKQTKVMSQQDSEKHYEQQKENYDREYLAFSTAYNKGDCYLCGKPFSTISKAAPCLHWLLRRCKFKTKDFSKIYENYDYYHISSYLRWVANTEGGSKNINNLKEESSERKVFEITIKWNNIEWTLDCSNNDFNGHSGSKTDFPHWHFQMRIDSRQFINFGDFHIPFSKDDQMKISLERDSESGFQHTYGPGGLGMQERMDQLSSNPKQFLEHSMSVDNPEDGAIHMQSVISAPDGGISGDKINEALKMHRDTGKTLQYCFSKVLESDEKTSIMTIASPAESVPEIAKRTERKRR